MQMQQKNFERKEVVLRPGPPVESPRVSFRPMGRCRRHTTWIYQLDDAKHPGFIPAAAARETCTVNGTRCTMIMFDERGVYEPRDEVGSGVASLSLSRSFKLQCATD